MPFLLTFCTLHLLFLIQRVSLAWKTPNPIVASCCPHLYDHLETFFSNQRCMFHNTLSNPYSCPISLSWLFTTLSTLLFSLPCLFFIFLFMRFYFPFWLLIVNAVSKDARFCLLFYCYCCNSRLAALSPGRPLCFSSYSFELREFKLCIINLSCSKVKEIVRSFHVNDNSWFRIPRPFVQMVLDSAVWGV